MMFSIFRLETITIENIVKTEAISMSEGENLTKIKVNKSQEKYLNFAKLTIREFRDVAWLCKNN